MNLQLLFNLQGYIILPFDLIPDALPGGFAYDNTAIVYVVKKTWRSLTPHTKQKARARLKEWFGDVSDSDLDIPK